MPASKSINPFAVLASLPTGDVRGPSQDSQRAKSHNTKWKNGQRAAAGKKCSHNAALSHPAAVCSDCAVRPIVPNNIYKPVCPSEKARNVRLAATANKKYARADIDEGDPTEDYANSDESDSHSVEHADSASLPIDVPSRALDETAIMYSYDSKSGPQAGNDILSNAVIKAVTKFENKQTEKLIKTEYDLISATDVEEEHIFAADDEDDFEMIDKADYIK